MSIPITFNGVSYDIPEFRDTDYANDLTNFFVAIPNGTLQPASGTFTLLAELNFGTSFGIQAKQLALGAALDSSSILSISSTTKGFLPPRMTTAQRDAIVSPTAGLLIYNTTTNLENFYNGTSWIALSADSGTVNAGTQYQLGYYAANGDTISGLPLITGLRALESDANGLPIASAVTSTELGYVSGVTSAIQTQLNSKATDSLVVHLAGTETITGQKTFSLSTLFADGTNLLPGMAFASDVDTGIYRIAENFIGFAVAGVRRFSIGPSDVTCTFNFLPDATVSLRDIGSTTKLWQQIYTSRITLEDGTAGAPALSFLADTYLGIRRQASNTLQIVANSVGAASFSNTGCAILGTTTNDAASTGYVGQWTNSNLARSSTTGTTANTASNVVSITLTAGDWDIRGAIGWRTQASTTGFFAAINTTSATLPTGDSFGNFSNGQGTIVMESLSIASAKDFILAIPTSRISIASTTTYYLVQQTDAANQVYGYLEARRVR